MRRHLATLVACALVAACTSSTAQPSAPGAGHATISIVPPTPDSEVPSATAPGLVTPEPTVPANWASYTSPNRGYSIDYPADWRTVAATQAWPANGFSYPDDPAVDKWVPPTQADPWVLMFVSEQPLEAGETASVRLARLDADNATACQLSNRRTVAVDGQQARREDGRCFGTDFISEVAVVQGGRLYLLYVLSGGPLGQPTLATFDRFVGSFRFR